MKLSQTKDIMKINWDNFYVIIDAQITINYDIFELTPEEFLTFAKEDFKIGDKKNLVGALSNSKRAIDCQIDWIISYLGYDFTNFDEKKYPNVGTVIEEFESGLIKKTNFSLKLKFVQSLEISPILLISRIREIRNKLEHKYVLPKIEDAQEAIEIAELFINSTQNVILNKFYSNYIIQNDYDETSTTLASNHISISFMPEYYDSHIDLHYYNGETQGDIVLSPTDEEYIFFIKAAISHDFSYLSKAFGYGPDRKFIKYSMHQG